MNCGNCEKFIVEGALVITILVSGAEINFCSETCHKELEKNVHPIEKNYTTEASRLDNYEIRGGTASTIGVTDSGTEVTFKKNI